MTKGEFAKAAGVTPRQVDNLVIEGLPQTTVGRRYDYGADAIVWHYGRKLERERGTRSALKESQERLEAARAKKAALELDALQGNLVEVDAVRAEWARIVD